MIRRSTIFTLIVLCVCFFSCKKGNNNAPKSNVGKALVLTPLEEQKAQTDNAFAFKLFNATGAGDSVNTNVFLSPLSVSFALAMTSNGANGSTLDAIRTAMDFNGFSQSDLNTYYNNLITNMPELDPNTTLNIANSIWYRQGLDVLPDFISTNTNSYKAKVAALDFNSASAIQTINDWVNTQTNGKIPTILNTIPSDAEMYLINALYFKSTWNAKFDPANTKPLTFNTANGSQKTTPFMSGSIDYNYYTDGQVNIVELPYSNQRYSMVLIKPASATATIKDLSASLDSTKWAGWMSHLAPINGQVTMPKFSFSYNVQLNGALTSLGMGIAFSDLADFSKISASGGLKINKVVHKTFVAVDETGTTAAAVTSVGVIVSVAAPSPPIIFDRPFIIVIREMHTGLILFTGVVNDPTLSGE